MNTNILFASGDLSAVLRSQVEKMKQAINNFDPTQLQKSDVNDLVTQFVASASVEPLELDLDRIKSEQRATKVDVSHRFDYAPWANAGPHEVDGIEVTVRVPFKGDPLLFRLRPSQFSLNPPHGAVVNREIILAEAGVPQDAARIKADLEREFDGLKQHVNTSRNDVVRHNAALAGVALATVEERRHRLSSMPDVASSFSFVKKTSGES